MGWERWAQCRWGGRPDAGSQLLARALRVGLPSPPYTFSPSLGGKYCGSPTNRHSFFWGLWGPYENNYRMHQISVSQGKAPHCGWLESSFAFCDTPFSSFVSTPLDKGPVHCSSQNLCQNFSRLKIKLAPSPLKLSAHHLVSSWYTTHSTKPFHALFRKELPAPPLAVPSSKKNLTVVFPVPVSMVYESFITNIIFS